MLLTIHRYIILNTGEWSLTVKNHIPHMFERNEISRGVLSTYLIDKTANVNVRHKTFSDFYLLCKMIKKTVSSLYIMTDAGGGFR
jgi:hypothetical protein